MARRWCRPAPTKRTVFTALRWYLRRLSPMLEGKRIFITGGAGFIGTTLAAELVDANQVIAVDNLHRNTLTGTALADHPNFEFHEADVLDGDAIAELAQGATH